MSSLQQSLRALHAVDVEIETTRQRVRSLQAELADDNAVVAARTQAETTARAAATATEAVRTGEHSLQRLDRTIVALQKRLYDGSIHNAKEATSVEEELRHRRAERSATEDAVLAAMERVEDAQAAAALARQRCEAAETARATRIPALKAEGREAMAKLHAIQAQRTALAAATPPVLLSRYERLRAVTQPAVVSIHDGACGGCGVAIPTAMRQKVAADELAQCFNCNRMLVAGSQ